MSKVQRCRRSTSAAVGDESRGVRGSQDSRGALKRHGGSPAPAGTANRGGFTVFELVLVVTIIGILSAILIPQVSRYTSKSAVARSAEVVQEDLERAFSLAARLRKPVTLTADNSGKIYQITDASNNVLLTRNLKAGQEYGVESMSFSSTPVTVQPNGVASDSLTVTLISRGSTRVVSMTRVGLIRRTQ